MIQNILENSSKYKIEEAFEKLSRDKNIHIRVILTDTLIKAVLKAREIAVQGDIITLSPACASFDMFRNFEVRGNAYKEIVNNLK